MPKLQSKGHILHSVLKVKSDIWGRFYGNIPAVVGDKSLRSKGWSTPSELFSFIQ